MVAFDEKKGCYVVTIDTYRNGKRTRKRETLPRLATEQEALEYEAKLLTASAPETASDRLRRLLEAVKTKPGNAGYIYAVRNMDDPGAIKIGKTSRSVSKRIHDLQTATLGRWEIVEYVAVTHMDDAEEIIHSILDKRRIDPRREFFDLPAEHAKLVLRIAAEVLT
jgi:hypothetical protein